MSKRKFAAFDIDGTIFRYALFQALVERLVEKDVIPSKTAHMFETEMNNWKNRTHSESFREFSMAQVRVFDDHITTIAPADLEQAATEILNESAQHVYVYTRDLIESLRKKNYFLIAISGSVSEIAHPFARKYGFDVVESSEYIRKDGKYTGKFELKHTDKHVFLEKIIAENNLTTKDSIAIGDSYGDISMLQFVENPIAFNPEEKLFTVAREHGWDIVVERKNMTYKLEMIDEQYRLA